ncbi:hypothetical protein HELRODRAFT_170360 [Helobdella robusta]|uniref:PHD-type domain-containing protein n=1 Tax=Helobdella robusta TaxID=6412 RepID=T1F2Y9_HELRO|nr:hypothetical protein HELRODRAFT_170360 [Helobdella robusta]ESO07805.1 hypothetical protein HELRODRAFT_170360 [Helobdella robusta]
MVLIKSYKCKRDRRRKSKVKKWSRPRKVCIIRKNFFDGCSSNISNNNSCNFTVLPTRQTLTYAEAQKFVDVLTDGHVHRLDILDRLVIEDSTNTIKTIESHFCFENNEMSPPIAGVKTCSVKEIDYSISNTSDANCKKPNSFGLPVSYIRSFDLLPDDLDTEVEYDVDEEDIHWLKLLNEHRKLQKQSTLSVDMLECILDKLEKESHVITMSSPFVPSSTTLNDHNNVKKYSSSRNLNSSFSNKNTTDNNITSNSNCSDASRSNDVSKDGKLKVQKCGVCRESQTSPTNAMIVCNGCSLTVHQDCYGVPYYPDGEWLCKKCLKSPNTPVKCVLCPCSWRSQGGGPGAMKQTDDGRWVHILCALFIPEVTFGSNVYLEPVEKIEKVPRWRSEMRCWGCNRTGRGACLCCQAPQCCRSFHALCAIKKGCFLKIFNSSLSSASADFSGTNSVNNFSSNKTTKRIGDRRNRLFYCHRHKHLAYEDKQRNADCSEKKSSFNNLSLHSYLASSSTAFPSRVNGSVRPKKISSSLTRLKNNSRGRKELLHTRRQRQRRPLNHRQPQYLSENKLGTKRAKKRCRSKMAGDVNQLTHLSMPIEIPDIPQHRLEALSTSLPVRDKEFLMACIHRYWLLKRHSRDGLPLIQRLQQILLIHQTIKFKIGSSRDIVNSSSLFPVLQIQLESSSRSTTTTTATTRMPSSMLSASSSSTAATMMMSLDENSLKLLRRWRQDYEKVRLLLELIRKREKMKFELVKLKEHMLELQLEPFNVLLKHTLEQLMMKDAIGLFAYPVTDEEAPGYSDIISHPMDYWTMGEKINNHQYSNFDEFESDFQLIIDNCTLYNGAGSVLDNIGIRHKKQCAIILESARRMCNRAGYCPISGVHVTMETEGNDNGECKLEVDSSRTGDTSLNDTVLYSLNGDGDDELLNDSDVKSNHIHHHHRRYLRTFVNRCRIDGKNNRRNICTANYNSVDKKVMNAVNVADDFGSPDAEMTNEKKVLDSRLDELLSRLDALYVIHSKNRLYQIKKTKKEIARLRRRITFIDQQLTNHKTPRSCSSRSKSKSKSASPPVTRNLRSCRALVFQGY